MAVSNVFASGIDGANFEPNVYEQYGDMIGKLAKSFIRNVQAKNPLAVFDKGRIDNGDTIENVVIGLLESSGYADNTPLANQGKGNIVAEYFKNWLYKRYSVTIKPDDLRKIRPQYAEDDVSSMASRIVGSLDQSAMHEHFKAFKEMLKWGATSGSYSEGTALVDKGNIDLINGKTDYKGILKKIKDIVDGMSFVNADYNAKGFEKSTNKEDIYIIMPYAIKNAIDVDELSGVFNLQKAEIERKIIVTDSAENYIYVVDKNAILSFTRLYEVKTQENAQGNYYNYFLHTDRLMALSPVFDGVFFTYDVEEDANLINLVPYVASDVLGKATSDLQEGVQVRGNNIKGTLKYVTGYTGFSGDVAEQSGNYLAVYLPIPEGATAKADLVGGTTGEQTLDDGIMVLRITDKDAETLKISVTSNSQTAVKVFSLSGLTLQAE